ncbi:hypothetical protein UPYG_G00072640 [Umbra pygmaea]|uniref:MADF domain-containing protein n=1 Tax=Umbra pygmaea TaxID=75934 RepID=A0ABD0XF36_UMBPY
MASDKLIHLVSQHKPLYDKQSADYKNTEYKDRVWQLIAEQLEKQDVEAVKKMLRNLRDTYVRYRKEGQGRSGQGASKKKKWIHMDSMSFLQKSLTRRRSDGNIQMDDDEEEENGIGEDDVTQTEESDSVVMETEREGSTTPSGSCIVKSKKIQAESEDNLDRCRWELQWEWNIQGPTLKGPSQRRICKNASIAVPTIASHIDGQETIISIY